MLLREGASPPPRASITPLAPLRRSYIAKKHAPSAGGGAFVGVETNLPLVAVYGRAGLGWLDDADMTELLIGARVGIGLIGLFAEYRMLTLEPDGGASDLDIDGYRVGVRVAF